MSFARRYLLALVAATGLGLSGIGAEAAVNIQCPATITNAQTGQTTDPLVYCKHLSAGDGFSRMATGRTLYTFGFSDLTGVAPGLELDAGILAAQFTAPTLVFKEGTKAYLTLTNVGMLMRPDLFDPHTVHFHGFPNAATVYDGEPEASFGINMQESLNYYYNLVEAGTFIYHCHAEATEHMQMGMLGNLYVTPRQNGTPYEYPPNGGKTYTQFVYNDGDGSTGYDVEFPLQLGSMDPVFHDLHIDVQPLPFANMLDTFQMLNGRGYPDTVNPDTLPPPDEKVGAGVMSSLNSSNPVSSLISATAGQTILLRISNLSVTKYYTLGVMGLKMKVVGTGSHILRGPRGTTDISYETNSVNLGGGETADVLIDTTGVAPGTYMVYTTNLNYLSNDVEDFGGIMTEIRIN